MVLNWFLLSSVTVGIFLASPSVWAVSSTPTDFGNLVPNGCAVPNPCDTTKVWCGVGYEDPTGGAGHTLDPFGVDLAANNYVWNSKLCNEDSDGDGKTNGEELGDPTCIWTATAGASPCSCASTPMSGISDPGVCEPLNSPRCVYVNRWLNCTPDFDCPAINSPDVIEWNIQIPEVTIPVEPSSYMCYFIPLPNATKYHLIATVGLLQNYEMIDYVTVYGCWDVPQPAPPSTPYSCPLNPPCYPCFANYQFGQSFDCTPSEFGFPIGAENGYKYAIVQIHYVNPSLTPGVVDQSGIRFYYTSKLRPNDGGLFNVGAMRLDIPPQQPWVVQTGYCTQACGMPPKPLYLTRLLTRMNYLGRAVNASIYRNGALHTQLMLNMPYSYNTAGFYDLDPYVEYLPGDVIRVDCGYNSMSTDCTTFYGDAMTDEFCFVLPWYYPLVNGYDICLTYGQDPVCNTFFVVPGCNTTLLFGLIKALPNMAQSCNFQAGCSEPCVNGAIQQLDDIGCLVPDVRDLLITYIEAQEQSAAGPAVGIISLLWGCRGMPPEPPQPDCIGTTAAAATPAPNGPSKKKKEEKNREHCKKMCINKQHEKCVKRSHCRNQCSGCKQCPEISSGVAVIKYRLTCN